MSNDTGEVRIVSGILGIKTAGRGHSRTQAAWGVITAGQPRPAVWLKILSLMLCLAAVAAGFSVSAQAQSFEPVQPLSFTMPFGGANPLAQVATIGSTGSPLYYSTAVTTSSGGSWLSLSGGSGCCYYTPQAITVIASPAAGLAAGTYTGLITVTSGTLVMKIPVSLTIEPSTAAFFDAPAGALTFSMGISGKAPPLQPLPIRNAGAGTLGWTASATTSDGGGWITLSATSGSAPSLLNVGINPAKLPGGDALAGTYTGQVALHSGSDTVTIPITIAVGASVFHQINPLSFTTAFGQTGPPAQVISLAAADASSIYFDETTINSTGGDWLTVSTSGCCYYTPQAITVSANPAVTLAAGTYTAEVVLHARDGSQTILVPVTLHVEPASATFFGGTDGALTFAMQTSGLAPAAQPVPIRSAGVGTLAWTAAATTADGGAWLTLSAASGTAPSTLVASVVPANLPGGGLLAGTYVGQVVLTTSGDTVTIPVSFTVGASALRQINQLSFTKVFGGGNPSSQVISLAAVDGSSVYFDETTISSTGGNWLSVSTSGCCYYSPQAITVTVNPDVTLAAGIYTAEIVLRARSGNQAVVVPVTLEIEPATAAFFDNTNGALTFSMVTGGTAPPLQAIPIRNAGTGTLAWTATTSTADGGSWLTVSAASGTSPSTLNVGVNPSRLPGGGLTAGTYVGEIVLTGAGDTITIPVSLTVSASAFQQIDPLVFTKTYAGGNPAAQVIDLSAETTSVYFQVAVVNATGGNWLMTSINGCCYYSPYAITVSVSPAVTLAAGTYTAEVILSARDGSQSMVVPVTLVIKPAGGATYFDALPGALTYSMITSGTAPPAQLVQIRNAGTGTLAWTASASTSDGGNWITLSATSGNAPYLLNVGVVPAALPGRGLIAGNYTGQVTLTSAADTVTIPISMKVGPSVFTQINPLSFSKVYSGANPLPQAITLGAVDNSSIQFSASVVSSTGGNWLSIPISGCCYNTPTVISVSANPAVTLAAGTYFAEVILTARDGSQSVVVPVTLNVEASNVSFFDTLQGGLTFSMEATGVNPPAQALPIRDAGPGTLNWGATAMTADGGKWLNISAGSGTAPIAPAVSINAANLPGKGKIAGVYMGQVMLQTVGDIVSIPVTVSVGTSVIAQLAPVSFTKSYQGANPAVQVVTLNSTSASLQANVLAYNSTGGSWLSITQNGCCYNTPTTLALTVNPAVNLAPGVYTAEVIASDRAGASVSVIPVSLTVTTTAATATPTFNPPGGTYSSDQSVVMSDATIDAAIYYTTDGTTPTTASLRYSSPIQVTKTGTVKAIAIAPGYNQSAVYAATYTITAPVAATPQATITIAEATTGVTVYYTTNGTTPTSASAKYTGPIALPASGTLTVKFIAIGPSYTQSAVRTISTSVQ